MPDLDLDHHWMEQAIELSKKCPPATDAYSVGAILIDPTGNEIARGYSRESDPRIHAEEALFSKLDEHRDLAGGTLYSTLEPCSKRSAARTPCTELIIELGIRRVVIAWREPPLFVTNCIGVELLRGAAVSVVELPELANAAKSVNRHLGLSLAP